VPEFSRGAVLTMGDQALMVKSGELEDGRPRIKRHKKTDPPGVGGGWMRSHGWPGATDPGVPVTTGKAFA